MPRAHAKRMTSLADLNAAIAGLPVRRVRSKTINRA
jgi:hypothetical protein